MASLNSVTLLGNLTRDPELRSTPQGTAVATFGLAVNRRYRQEDQPELLDRLQASQPKRGWLGIGLKSQDNPAGILVTQVMKNSPAAQAGLESNDLIVRLNGSDVHDSQTFIRIVGTIPPETTVDIDVIRGDQHHTIPVTVGLRPVIMPQQ